MKAISTRGDLERVSFSQTLIRNLASDGGLWVFERIPLIKDLGLTFNPGEYDRRLSEIAKKVLYPWLKDEPLGNCLDAICDWTYSFPAPLVFLKSDLAVLELFHGPTAAFKDFGARFLSECLSRMPDAEQEPEQEQKREKKKGGWVGQRVVLVATSGDTGSAVASAFFGRPGFRVVILYPKGKVSGFQEKQLTTWGGNIHAFSVRGDFDDCQRMVKEGFLEQNSEQNSQQNASGKVPSASSLRHGLGDHRLISANSISLGRLLPQTVYYAAASMKYFHRTQHIPGIIVPTGNLGNAIAALWAKKMGFPIREVLLATNANRPIVEYFRTGKWQPFPTVSTLANAMDVGNPSNMERLQVLYPRFEDLEKEVSAISVSDSEICEEIRRSDQEWNRVFCPHTATAAFAWRQQKNSHWIIAATAHPIKFESIVRPWISGEIELPSSLAQLFSKVSVHTDIDPHWADLTKHLSKILSSI